MLNRYPQLSKRTNSKRQSGFAAILVAGAWLVLCGLAALSFDMSRLYSRKAEAQKAADAAALAGAYGEGIGSGRAKALEYASKNGYDVAAGATVDAGPESNGLYRVTLKRPEPVYFARLFFGPTADVGATAAAEYLSESNVPLQNYGKAGDAISLSVFGPDAFKQNGDPYSVKYLTQTAADNNAPDNPDYKPEGYDFNMLPAADYAARHTDKITGKAILQLEIYDPGTENIDPSDDYARAGKQIDEIRDGWFGKFKTTTRFTVTYDNGTPNNPADDIVRSKVYGPSNPGPDMAWDTPAEFQFDIADPQFNNPSARFNLNVTTTDGSSENGFDLRAGPPHPALTDAEWVTQFGTDVRMSGKGSLPLNFNKDGEVIIDLGIVPPMRNGGTVKVDKYDMDVTPPGVTANSIAYYQNGTFFQNGSVLLSADANGVWTPDVYPLAKGYGGANWTAKYNAGSNDTTIIKMSYTGPGNFRLVR